MNNLSVFSLSLVMGFGSLAGAQTPAGKDAAPGETAPAAAAEPTRAAVGKWVTDLKALVAAREKSATRLITEITALDHAIQEAVDTVLRILTTAKDSVDSRSKVTKMKEETMAALKRAAQAYAQKRSLIAEELRTSKNEYRREDLFDSRGKIDERIDKMVDAMLKLALSMETDEGHERYIQDSTIMVGGRYGIAVPTTRRNPEFDQNKRQTGKTEKVAGEIDKAFETSLKRLDTQEKDLAAKLARPEISAEEKERLGAEIVRIQAIREERLQQQAQFEGGPYSDGQSELDRKGAIETEEIVDETTAGARRDFTRMMAAFNALRTERQALASLKAKLDHAVKWLETHPDAK